MVTCNLIGRTGNQMFQIAATIAYAKKHNLPFHIPAHTLDDRVWPPTFTHLTNPQYIPILDAVKVDEREHSYHELAFDEAWREKNIILQGYFQSYRYFDWCFDDIRKAFGLFHRYKEHWVSVHVRRGDYLQHPDKHPCAPLSYYREAFSWLRKYGLTNYWIFSDDLDWCKQNLNLQTVGFGVFAYRQSDSPLDDIEFQSYCAHNIICNSTFSWWAAMLNPNPYKIVISPDEDSWFGEGNKHLSVRDLIPSQWVRIPFKKEKV